MDWFKDKEKADEEWYEGERKAKAPEPPPVFNPPVFVKTDNHCEVEGCEELKAIERGQNHVCVKHIRNQ